MHWSDGVRRGLAKPTLSNLINPQTEVSIRIRLDHESVGFNSFDHVYEAHSCNQAELEKFQSWIFCCGNVLGACLFGWLHACWPITMIQGNKDVSESGYTLTCVKLVEIANLVNQVNKVKLVNQVNHLMVIILVIAESTWQYGSQCWICSGKLQFDEFLSVLAKNDVYLYQQWFDKNWILQVIGEE